MGLTYMLDREVVKEFLMEQLEETGNLPIPKNINEKELIEAFCQFTEDDYYEWLKDNFQSFFNHGDPDWEWIENDIKKPKLKER
jgi:hypothetical protein